MSISKVDKNMFGEKLDGTKLPTQAEIEYVEVYDYNLEEGIFTLRYHDEFDTFNP